MPAEEAEEEESIKGLVGIHAESDVNRTPGFYCRKDFPGMGPDLL